MSSRQILLIALAASALVPASAAAAPTVTVTGDDGNPVGLNAAAPTTIRNIDPDVDVTVPADRRRAATRSRCSTQDGTPVTTLSPCRATKFGPTWKSYAEYRGNGTYTAVLRLFASDTDCNGTVRESRYQYVVNGGTSVTAPPARLLTRAAELVRHHHAPARLRHQPRRDLVRDPLRAGRRHRP